MIHHLCVALEIKMWRQNLLGATADRPEEKNDSCERDRIFHTSKHHKFHSGQSEKSRVQFSICIAHGNNQKCFAPLYMRLAYYYLGFCPGANHRATLNLPRIIVGSLP